MKYLSDGKDEVVANAGDYIYPADVRFEHASGLLYVKAAGVTAAFSNPQTWLFEYDLLQRRSILRVRVNPNCAPARMSGHLIQIEPFRIGAQPESSPLNLTASICSGRVTGQPYTMRFSDSLLSFLKRKSGKGKSRRPLDIDHST